MGEKKKRWQSELDETDQEALFVIGGVTGMAAGLFLFAWLAKHSHSFALIMFVLFIIVVSFALTILWGWCIRTLWLRHQRDKEYFKDDDES